MSTTMKFYKPEPGIGLLNVRKVKLMTFGLDTELNLPRRNRRRNPTRAEAIYNMRLAGYVTKAEVKPSHLRNFVRVVHR